MRHRKSIVVAGVLLGVLVWRGSGELTAQKPGNQGTGAFSFALIGDMPYGALGQAQFPAVISDINADRQLSFVVHDGDFKNGSTLCDDATFDRVLGLFNQFNAPFIYVPGDNEWTDCHRANNGAYDPLERLAALRLKFFPTDQTLGRRTATLDRQSNYAGFDLYRENVRWQSGSVVFVGLHVVGSNNNLGRNAENDAEYAARNAANLAWVAQSFDIATAMQARAVMIIVQANPDFELPRAERTGFNDFIDQLEAETLGYGRPVVLVHGDSHYFRIDKPLVRTAAGQRIEHFTRVETFGQNDNHWLHVAVDPGNPNVFTFSQRIVAANVVR